MKKVLLRHRRPFQKKTSYSAGTEVMIKRSLLGDVSLEQVERAILNEGLGERSEGGQSAQDNENMASDIVSDAVVPSDSGIESDRISTDDEEMIDMMQNPDRKTYADAVFYRRIDQRYAEWASIDKKNKVSKSTLIALLQHAGYDLETEEISDVLLFGFNPKDGACELKQRS